MFEKKKLWAGAVCMAALLTLLVGCGEKTAQSGQPKPDIEETPLSDFSVAYDTELQGAVIEKYLGSALKVRIPDEVEGEPIVKIGKGAFEKSNVMYVYIPDTVKVIGSDAFKNCEGMPSIDLPDGVTEIGKGAFRCCDGLTSIEIPSGVTELKKEVFCSCEGLTEVVIPGNVKEIGEEAFSGCRNLKRVEISEGVTTIGSEAFSVCLKLTDIQIPDSVTSIGESAFSACDNLSEESIARIRERMAAING